MAEAPDVVGALFEERAERGSDLPRAEKDSAVYKAENTVGQNVRDGL